MRTTWDLVWRGVGLGVFVAAVAADPVPVKRPEPPVVMLVQPLGV